MKVFFNVFQPFLGLLCGWALLHVEEILIYELSVEKKKKKNGQLGRSDSVVKTLQEVIDIA